MHGCVWSRVEQPVVRVVACRRVYTPTRENGRIAPRDTEDKRRGVTLENRDKGESDETGGVLLFDSNVRLTRGARAGRKMADNPRLGLLLRSQKRPLIGWNGNN
jgi:hypothetical protein